MAAGSPGSEAPADGQAPGERDVRPIVRLPASGVSGLTIAIVAIVAAVLLFLVLDTRRRSLQAPATFPTGEVAAPSAAPPPLYVPPAPMPVPARDEAPLLVREAPQPSYEPPPPPQIVYMPQPSAPPVAAPPPPRVDASPALVVDMASPGPPAAATAPGETGAAGPAEGPVASTGRTRAATFANPSTTVPQGTLIHAVLETGFDSTRPGFARALVQRDVRGFDGKRVLIPRGSRLIGEYSGAAVQGQKRALILWSRLIRPDGITISIGSPATDTVGRGGVRAKVDSHFLERFGGALLQSVLDIGVNLAARSSDSPVIIAVPGAAHGAASLIKPAEIPPTLKVTPGTSISVFVARDLDFTGAEAQR